MPYHDLNKYSPSGIKDYGDLKVIMYFFVKPVVIPKYLGKINLIVN
jgi:hypothetical protein